MFNGRGGQIKHKFQQNKQIIALNRYKEWQDLQKRFGRVLNAEFNKRAKFLTKLNYLFDVAHDNAFNVMKNAESKQLLVLQRKDERQNPLAGIDKKFEVREGKKQERLEKKKKKDNLQEMQCNGEVQLK